MKLTFNRSFDYIVTSNADFVRLFTRVSAGNYKINDGIKSVFINQGGGSGSVDANKFMDTGNYEMDAVLSGGDTAATGIKIATNDCVWFYCESGTQFDWDNIKCQWLIEKKEFIGENCQNIGDADMLNIEDASGDPTTAWAAPTNRGGTLISSAVADSGEGGGLLRNWAFSGFGAEYGYRGQDSASIADVGYKHNLILENCLLRGCQRSAFTGFRGCIIKNCSTIGNNLDQSSPTTVQLFQYCTIVGWDSLNDGYESPFPLMVDCRNISNVHVRRAMYSASTTGTLDIFSDCVNISNITLTDVAYDISGAAGQVTLFEACERISNFDIVNFAFTSSNTGDSDVFNICNRVTNGDILGAYYAKTGNSNLTCFNACNSVSNVIITTFARTTITTGTVYVISGGVSFTNITLIDCIKIATVPSGCRGFSGVTRLSGCSVIDSMQGNNASAQAFGSCLNIVGCTIESSCTTATDGRGFTGCDQMSACAVLGTAPTTTSFSSCDYVAACFATEGSGGWSGGNEIDPDSCNDT